MAVEIDVGIGSIRNHLDKLIAEGVLQGLKADPKLSDEDIFSRRMEERGLKKTRTKAGVVYKGVELIITTSPYNF
jgi:hypothetical protein